MQKKTSGLTYGRSFSERWSSPPCAPWPCGGTGHGSSSGGAAAPCRTPDTCTCTDPSRCSWWRHSGWKGFVRPPPAAPGGWRRGLADCPPPPPPLSGICCGSRECSSGGSSARGRPASWRPSTASYHRCCTFRRIIKKNIGYRYLE